MIDRGWHPIQVWIKLGEQTRLRRVAKAKRRTMAGYVRNAMLLEMERDTQRG
jgi:hypothetical protein